jgi:glyoxylase-like metal-dependent hydrolase (beta-lactamase superfamily II)
MGALRMFLLRFGTERIPRFVSVLGGDGRLLTEPIFGAVVETTEGLVLLDTGIGRAALADPAAMAEIYRSGGPPTGPTGWPGPDGDPLALVLAGLDLKPADLSLAAVSHLHVDHTGGIPPLTATGVPIAIQAQELDYGRHRAEAGTGLEVAFYASDYTDPRTDWRRLDGGAEIAPGISVIPTPGHTPGHQSFRVDLPRTGTWILAADAADLAENLHQALPCGIVAEPSDTARAAASTAALLELAERTDARVLPGHDPIVWKAAWHPPGGHR